MTAQPISADQGPDTGAYQVIRLGDQSAVVVPMADFLKLRALERQATVEAIEDAEDAAALEEWRGRDFSGESSYVSAGEARRRLGLER
ncbi:MAG: hypothetical protein QG622_1169 [Actinomycetota bacterium]|nr:hypothetical protein [Actinomycetota bacterium]